jgi:hypothetical protein
MEFLFLLVLIAIAFAIVGGVVLAIALLGRRRQLSSRGGTLDAQRPEDEPADGEDRPEHVQVDTGQRARFIGSR